MKRSGLSKPVPSRQKTSFFIRLFVRPGHDAGLQQPAGRYLRLSAPSDAYLFGRINGGNAASVPLGLNFGWGN